MPYQSLREKTMTLTTPDIQAAFDATIKDITALYGQAPPVFLQPYSISRIADWAGFTRTQLSTFLMQRAEDMQGEKPKTAAQWRLRLTRLRLTGAMEDDTFLFELMAEVWVNNGGDLGGFNQSVGKIQNAIQQKTGAQ
jgi:hypothetical protein